MNSRPLQHLQKFNKLYPKAWQLIDRLRQARGKDIPNWPNWCFLPMSGFYAIISERINKDRLPFSFINDISILTALGSWRITQGIYRFDTTLESSLIDSTITGDIPVDVFYRLPEWCVYIETNDIEYFGKKLHGFFVHLEYDANTGRSELRLLLDHDDFLECNGQLKQDTFLSSLPIEFPFKFQRGLIA
ncbi:MAG TPA: hypothetical protein VIF10_10620 [Methylobacter sp.]|jgi:hypothetical protein